MSTRSTKEKSKKKEDPGTCSCNSKKGGMVIQCEGCQRWCHPSCVCLSTELVQALESVANYCPVCVLKKVAAPQPASAPVTQDDERADIAKSIPEFDTMKAEIRDLKKSLQAINGKLKDNPKGSHAGSPPEAGDTLRAQQKIIESHERALRRNNVIVVGLPDEGTQVNADEKVSKLLADKLQLQDLRFEVRRLGKKVGRVAPFLAIFKIRRQSCR